MRCGASPSTSPGCPLLRNRFRKAESSRCRSINRAAYGRLLALHPFDCRTGAHLEPIGRLAPRRTRFNCVHNSLAQLQGAWLRHRSALQNPNQCPPDSTIQACRGIPINSAEIRSNTILVLLCRGFHRLDLDVRRAAVQSLQHVVSTCPPIVAIVAVVMVARRDANQKSFGKRAWWRMPACLTLRQLLITLEF
jgi:hypothetical protein